MSSIGTGYDQSTTTFSPDGRVFQVEYATKAVDNSNTAVGIRCKDGVVMAVEKPKLSKMIVEGSNRRIMSVDKHSGICVSGMIADARQIVNHGRSEAARYRDFYGGSIPGQTLCDRIAGLMHTYTLYWVVRPFGTAVLIGGYSESGPQLHAVDPSGVSYRYFATAIGKGKNGAKSQLEKLDFETLTAREAVTEAARSCTRSTTPPRTSRSSWRSRGCATSRTNCTLVPPELHAAAEAAAGAPRGDG